jgi:hypothetical protein
MSYYSGGVPIVKVELAEQLQEAYGQYPVVRINDPRSDYVAKKTAR